MDKNVKEALENAKKAFEQVEGTVDASYVDVFTNCLKCAEECAKVAEYVNTPLKDDTDESDESEDYVEDEDDIEEEEEQEEETEEEPKEPRSAWTTQKTPLEEVLKNNIKTDKTFEDGYAQGYQDGFNKGFDKGYDIGAIRGFKNNGKGIGDN